MTGPDTNAPEGGAQDRQLLTLFELARLLAAQEALPGTLARALMSLTRLWDAVDTALVVVREPDGETLRVSAAAGYDAVELRGLELRPGEGMSGRVLQTGQGELYDTPEEVAAVRATLTPDNRRWLSRAAESRRPPQSAISLPLLADGTPLGALLLESTRRAHAFGPAEIGFFADVAELIARYIEGARRQEEEQAAAALEEANRLKAELASTLAHEMRTPLTSIKGYSTALLMETAAFGPETQREFLQIIDEETDVLQDLVRDFLESSIMDAGLLRLEPQPVRIVRLVEAIIDEMARRSPQHRFLVDFSRNFPIVDADPDRIQQVLRNLIGNAVKYSPDGGLVVVRGELGEREVLVSVADQGIGIAPEHLNRLFEKFFRVQSGSGRHVVGSGLGLPISRTIVESHGGRIWAESHLGHGTTLYFTLPLEGLGWGSAERKEKGDD